MLRFYCSGAPNPTKVALFLEETGMPMKQFRPTLAKGSNTSQNIWR